MDRREQRVGTDFLVSGESLGLDRVEQLDPQPSAFRDSDVRAVLRDSLAAVLVGADVDDASGLTHRRPHRVPGKDRPQALGRFLRELDLDRDTAARRGGGR